ncbi:MAG: hypothetical protein H8E03_01365 [Pelagibacteraceae bacterium]|nr:hypothetical protein [Pelagibacteraceae bacterium]
MSKKTIQEIAHRTCRKYKHTEYIFDDFTLIEFVDKPIEMQLKRKRNKMNQNKNTPFFKWTDKNQKLLGIGYKQGRLFLWLWNFGIRIF